MSKNGAATTVATPPTPATSGTTLTVATGTGARLFAGMAVLHPSGAVPTAANIEVVTITDVTGDVVTMTRAQESSAARTVVVGDTLTQGITAGAWDALVASAAAIVPLTRGGTGATTASAARTALGLGSAATMTPATIAADPALSATYVRYQQVARTPDQLISGAVTRDAAGAATSATVVWPDGSPGTYTGAPSTTVPGAIDSYTITYGSPVTRTYTQPAVTRDATGAAVTVPSIVVS